MAFPGCLGTFLEPLIISKNTLNNRFNVGLRMSYCAQSGENFSVGGSQLELSKRIPQTRNLDRRHFSSVPGTRNLRGAASLVSSGDSLLALQMTFCLLCIEMTFSLCDCGDICVFFSL